VRSFTTLCEKHPPEAMFAMLNAFLGGAEKELRAFGGQVDKFIGDAVMAVFREPGPEQALHAVQAALAVKAFLVEFNRRREAEGVFPIQIGVGISTGRVMQGNIGSERRKDLTVIGDEVNLAARLETASKEGRHTQIVLSEGTFALVRHAIEAVEMPQRTVKGKEQTIRMYEVVGPKK
jgi:class 3 adenylate cyclase